MRFYYKILLLSFVLIIIVPSICLGGNVRIFGSLKDFRSAKTELVWTGISSEIFNDYKINIEANSDGNFDITTDLREPGYYTLGKNIIYLKPGDVIELHPNSTSSKSVFKGVGSEFDDYLKGCGWQEGTQIISIGDKRSFSEIKHITDSIVNNRISALMNLKLGNNVNNMEIARLKAEQISLYFNYFVYAMFIQKGDNDSVKLAKKRNYFESVENYVYPLLKDISASGDFLEIPAVRKIIFECKDFGYFKIENSLVLTELIATMKKSLEMDRGVTKENFENLSSYANTIKNASIMSSYKNKLDARCKFIEGKPAVDFEMKDKSGNLFKLSDFKGEVLFIDFWATWCMPCLGQIPYFKLLSEKYSTIKFISISVDQDPEKWKKKVETDTEKAISNYIADVFHLQNSWDLTTIPRFLLIDKNFNIITAFAPRPSDKQTIENLLDKYK